MKMLTVKEVADLLQVHRSTVHMWVRTGRLPVVRLGRHVRVPEESLERWAGKSGADGEV